MKQKLLTLLLAVLSAFPLSAFVVDGITYEITGSNTCSVINCTRTGNVVIPSSVYNNAWYTVTEIGESAFSARDKVTSVEIPNTVKKIGKSAFDGCSGLTSVTIPNSVTTIGESAFFYCSSLTSVTIPNSVTTIGAFAFSDCSSLTSVTIPNSVTTIGGSAFKCCIGLKEVKIHSAITTIGSGAFESCSSLEKFIIDEDNPVYTAIDGILFSKDKSILVAFPAGYKTDTYEIPNSVTEISWDAFSGCSGLTSIEIPNSVTEIGGYAFYGCSGLTSVEIPNSVTTIVVKAFKDCSGLTSVTIPNSVKTIEPYAFSGCSGLTSVIIPTSVTKIYDSPFLNCSGLVKSAYPDALEENPFGKRMAVKYPAKDAVIEDGYIYNADKSALYFVPFDYEGNFVIPENMAEIGDNAFAECKSISSLTVKASLPPAATRSAFDDSMYLSTTLYVPEKYKRLYENNAPWSLFFNIEADTSDDESILSEIKTAEPLEFYNLGGVKVGNSAEGLPKGVYIVRQGAKTAKITI